MKIYIAGNTPDREREEQVFLKKKLIQSRLFSYHYLKIDKVIYKMLKLYIK